ncbi:transglutaminase domain-containing protein [Candidatus Gracilibacteria bacterium]|nr:transglutaminase domain-containing protein [Candidatus Gracilibacteria bacterium]
MLLSDYSINHKDLKWIAPNKFIHSDDTKIKELIREVVGKENNLLTVIIKICEFIKEHLEYNNPIIGLYTDFEALHKKKVDCGGFSTLFISMCHNIGIPARLVAGYWADRPGKEMHAWAEFMLPDKTWIPVDLSIEWLRNKHRENKTAKIGYLGSDRVAMSIGCDFEILENTNNQTSINILQTPFSIPKKTISRSNTDFNLQI